MEENWLRLLTWLGNFTFFATQSSIFPLWQLTVEPAVERYCICIPFFSPKHGDKWDWMTRVRRAAAQPNGESPEKAHTWLVLQFAYGNCCCTFTFRPVGRRFYTKWLATIQGQLGGWDRVRCPVQGQLDSQPAGAGVKPLWITMSSWASIRSSQACYILYKAIENMCCFALTNHPLKSRGTW